MFEEQKQTVAALTIEFRKRSERNSRYSLRAFAKSLGISHTVLSLVMAGKRTPSKQLTAKVYREIGFTDLWDYRAVPLETFEKIANWIHYAILSLVELKSFQKDPAWIAQRLNISTVQAREAVADLVRHGHLKQSDDGWHQATPPIAVPLQKTSGPARDFIRGFLRKAEEALDNEPIDVRDMTTITFTCSEEQVAAAREDIKNFRRGFCAKYENKPGADRVYTLAMQFFPISKK